MIFYDSNKLRIRVWFEPSCWSKLWHSENRFTKTICFGPFVITSFKDVGPGVVKEIR